MGLSWLIEGRADDFGAYRAFHVGDFFRSLTDEGNHQVSVIVVGGNGVGDGFEQHGFTGFGRRDDQSALPASNRRHQVDNTSGDVRWNCLQVEHLAWEDRCQDVEMGTALGDFGVYTVNGLDAQQAVVLLVVLWWANLAGDHIPSAPAKAANLRLRNIDIHVAW